MLDQGQISKSLEVLPRSEQICSCPSKECEYDHIDDLSRFIYIWDTFKVNPKVFTERKEMPYTSSTKIGNMHTGAGTPIIHCW